MEWLQTFDIGVLQWLRETLSTPFMDKLMVLISTLGNAGALWLFLGVLFLIMGIRRKNWRDNQYFQPNQYQYGSARECRFCLKETAKPFAQYAACERKRKRSIVPYYGNTPEKLAGNGHLAFAVCRRKCAGLQPDTKALCKVHQ